jgi:hypothetical protein
MAGWMGMAAAAAALPGDTYGMPVCGSICT